MKVTAYILFYCAYLPVYSLELYVQIVSRVRLYTEIEVKELRESFEVLAAQFDNMYAILTFAGIGLLIAAEKKSYLVPLYVLFFSIATFFAFDAYLSMFISHTLYATLFIILITIICTLLHVRIYSRQRHRRTTGLRLLR